MFQNKTVLITGGTGSFGKKLVTTFIQKKIKVKKLIIFSRDELKQFEMQKIYSPEKYKFLRYFIGDIRDKERLKFAFRDVNIVVHAAALKQVPTAEYNPIEYIKTNIIGAQNILEASLESNSISKVLALSTDKAVSPANLYGATKLCSDKLFLSANAIKGKQNIKFSVLRYGNVMMSRGSVIPNFLNTKDNHFNITDKRMTRFSLTLDDSVRAAFFGLKKMNGGEIIIPKAKSYRILDLAKAINDRKKLIYTGKRPGEKIDEVLIPNIEASSTYENKDYYVVMNHNKKIKIKGFKKVKSNFSYISDENNFLSVAELKNIIESQLKKND
ncbi:polysaccharide biosynthesis protein [Pelagibacteraceae bacterium]|jgi:UDP-N-acetylglucosamine 4,6-dehydratase/5-epimerase|nr:polysaccharide biosynthesis protein [Pelagibacteraceae bacterium]